MQLGRAQIEAIEAMVLENARREKRWELHDCDCWTCASAVHEVIHDEALPTPPGYDSRGVIDLGKLYAYYLFFEGCEEEPGAIIGMSSIKDSTPRGVAPPDDHIAIALPAPWPGRLIHCRAHVGVVIEPIATWRERITGFYRLRGKA